MRHRDLYGKLLRKLIESLAYYIHYRRNLDRYVEAGISGVLCYTKTLPAIDWLLAPVAFNERPLVGSATQRFEILPCRCSRAFIAFTAVTTDAVCVIAPGFGPSQPKRKWEPEQTTL